MIGNLCHILCHIWNPFLCLCSFRPAQGEMAVDLTYLYHAIRGLHLDAAIFPSPPAFLVVEEDPGAASV